MNEVYHGSKVQGLKEIKRNNSSHQRNWVYGTFSKATATIFINNDGGDFYYSLSSNGSLEEQIILTERKEGMFENIFNLSGSIYTLNSDNFQRGKTSWSAEVVSEFDEPVINEEYIENILEKLIELDKQGEIKLYFYPNRPDFIPLDNSDLIPKVIKLHNQGFKGTLKGFLSLYPELSDKLNEQLQNEFK